MILTKRYVSKRLQDRLVLWINPRSISYRVGTKWPVTRPLQKRIKALPNVPFLSKGLIRFLRVYHPFVIPARSYNETFPIESHDKYVKVKDLLVCRDDITSSDWYKSLAGEIEKHGVAKHKHIEMRTENDIKSFFADYALDLAESLATSGYCLDKGKDIGTVLVGPDGSLHKSASGNHRFHIARILGVSPVPVMVAGVHQAWYEPIAKTRKDSRLSELARSLAEVEQKHQ